MSVVVVVVVVGDSVLVDTFKSRHLFVLDRHLHVVTASLHAFRLRRAHLSGPAFTVGPSLTVEVVVSAVEVVVGATGGLFELQLLVSES